MAINATFSADFSDFVRGVRQADDSLDGLKRQTASSANAIGGLHQGLSQVDRILASLGINIGPQVRAIGEMANVSGKTARELGAVATAGLAVSAAFAGWTMGRWIADWFSLDEAIGKAAASLFGFGNEAAEIAGHKLDIMARATKIAGVEITNYNQALKIIKESTDKFADSMNTSAHRVALWNSELAKVKSDGKIEQLKADLESQNGTLKQLATEYGVSVEALQFFARETKVASEATKQFTETQTKAATELRAFRNWIGEREIEDHKRALDEQEKAEREYRQFQNWVGERQMQDEHARLMQREAEHKATLERMKAEEAAFIGLTITGGGYGGGPLATGPALPTTKFGGTGLGGGGVTVFGDGSVKGGPVATGAGVMVHPSISGGSMYRGGSNITINAPINVVDTQDNLARSIGAQITRAVMQGTKFS